MPLREHLQIYQLPSSQQHGFRKGRSFLYGLVLAREHWFQAMTEGCLTHIPYIGRLKQFPTTD